MAEMENASTLNLSEQEQIRRQKLAALVEAGQNPYEITRYDVTHHSTEIVNDYDALEGQTVSIAGRMTSRRIMGKASLLRPSAGRRGRYSDLCEEGRCGRGSLCGL